MHWQWQWNAWSKYRITDLIADSSLFLACTTYWLLTYTMFEYLPKLNHLHLLLLTSHLYNSPIRTRKISAWLSFTFCFLSGWLVHNFDMHTGVSSMWFGTASTKFCYFHYIAWNSTLWPGCLITRSWMSSSVMFIVLHNLLTSAYSLYWIMNIKPEERFSKFPTFSNPVCSWMHTMEYSVLRRYRFAKFFIVFGVSSCIGMI